MYGFNKYTVLVLGFFLTERTTRCRSSEYRTAAKNDRLHDHRGMVNGASMSNKIRFFATVVEVPRTARIKCKKRCTQHEKCVVCQLWSVQVRITNQLFWYLSLHIAR
jgi:hypothetical protein